MNENETTIEEIKTPELGEKFMSEQFENLKLHLQNMQLQINGIVKDCRIHCGTSKKIFESLVGLDKRVGILEESSKDVKIIKELLLRRNSIFPDGKQTNFRDVNWPQIAKNVGWLIAFLVASLGGATIAGQ